MLHTFCSSYVSGSEESSQLRVRKPFGHGHWTLSGVIWGSASFQKDTLTCFLRLLGIKHHENHKWVVIKLYFDIRMSFSCWLRGSTAAWTHMPPSFLGHYSAAVRKLMKMKLNNWRLKYSFPHHFSDICFLQQQQQQQPPKLCVWLFF